MHEPRHGVTDTDMRSKRKVKVSIDGRTVTLELDPVEIKEFEIR